MNAVVDLRARRRAASIRDAQSVVADIIDSTAAMHAMVAGWPMRCIRAELVVDGERQLDAIHDLLVELCGHVPHDTGTPPPRAA